MSHDLNDAQLLRYSRHILLPEISYEGQMQLHKARVLVMGVGGLGSPVALYLAAGGVGQLVLCDYDEVDLSNLQRQIVHKTGAIGRNKTESAQQALRDINPEVEVIPLPAKLGVYELLEWVAQVDLVIDCCDNFATRYLVNRVCVQLKKPLVSGAALHFEGQVSVFDARDANSPCYHCLFPDLGEEDTRRCSNNGVFSPLVGIIGSIQAAEAMKLLMGIGQVLQGRLLLFDARLMQWRTVAFARDPKCPVCVG